MFPGMHRTILPVQRCFALCHLLLSCHILISGIRVPTFSVGNDNSGHGGRPPSKGGAEHPHHRLPGDALEEAVPSKLMFVAVATFVVVAVVR